MVIVPLLACLLPQEPASEAPIRRSPDAAEARFVQIAQHVLGRHRERAAERCLAFDRDPALHRGARADALEPRDDALALEDRPGGRRQGRGPGGRRGSS